MYITKSIHNGAKLRRPNIHCALELCAHTIPMLSYRHNVSELALGIFHWKCKCGLGRNTHNDSHVTGKEIVLGKDWSTRVYHIYTLWEPSFAGGSTSERCFLEKYR